MEHGDYSVLTHLTKRPKVHINCVFDATKVLKSSSTQKLSFSEISKLSDELYGMGFRNRDQTVVLLGEHGGDLATVIERLVEVSDL